MAKENTVGKSAVVRDVCPEDFGAVGDRIHDDTAAVQKAIDHLGEIGGTVHLTKRYLVDSADLVVRAAVSLVGREGTIGNPGKGNDAGDEDYGSRGGQIVLNPKHKILLKGSACLKGLMFWRKGLTIPAPGGEGFEGTCIEIDGEDCYVGYSLIVGFDQAIKSAGHQRVTIEHVKGDCKNGIWIADSWDIAKVSDCHFWPFASVKGSGFERPGIGYRLSGVSDGTRISNCFEFGYRIGYQIDRGAGVTLLNCMADGVAKIDTPPYTTAGTIGFDIRGNARGCRLIGCEAWSKELGFNIEQITDDCPTAMNACKAEQVSRGVRSKGDLLMNGCDIIGINQGLQYGVGLEIVDKSPTQVIGCRFRFLDEAIHRSPDPGELVMSGNRFIKCTSESR